MGDNMVMIGDFVTRNSYNNDIVFKVIAIKGDVYYLSGVSIRLFADSLVDDLVICNNKEFNDEFEVIFDDYKMLDRAEYFYLPGKVLHIDSDISLSNNLLKPYKIRKKAKIQKYINH